MEYGLEGRWRMGWKVKNMLDDEPIAIKIGSYLVWRIRGSNEMVIVGGESSSCHPGSPVTHWRQANDSYSILQT